MPVKFTAEIEETKERIWGDIALSPAIIIDDHSQYWMELKIICR